MSIDRPLSFVPRRLFAGAILLATLASFGCASPFGPPSGDAAPSPAVDTTALAPLGPGAVFPTIEAAALDALAWSHLSSRDRIVSERRLRGGAIEAVDGGFSYREPVEAAPRAGLIRYPLTRRDVAHFRHYPAGAFDVSFETRRAIEREARRTVERRDPATRPLFYMTPDRFVRVVEVEAGGARTLARAEWGARADATTLAFMHPASERDATGQPLALQPPRP